MNYENLKSLISDTIIKIDHLHNYNLYRDYRSFLRKVFVNFLQIIENNLQSLETIEAQVKAALVRVEFIYMLQQLLHKDMAQYNIAKQRNEEMDRFLSVFYNRVNINKILESRINIIREPRLRDQYKRRYRAILRSETVSNRFLNIFDIQKEIDEYLEINNLYSRSVSQPYIEKLRPTVTLIQSYIEMLKSEQLQIVFNEQLYTLEFALFGNQLKIRDLFHYEDLLFHVFFAKYMEIYNEYRKKAEELEEVKKGIFNEYLITLDRYMSSVSIGYNLDTDMDYNTFLEHVYTIFVLFDNKFMHGIKPIVTQTIEETTVFYKNLVRGNYVELFFGPEQYNKITNDNYLSTIVNLAPPVISENVEPDYENSITTSSYAFDGFSSSSDEDEKKEDY